MNVPDNKKHEFWNHFITRWALEGAGGGFGVTAHRLNKIKPAIFNDNDFWSDVILRHDGIRYTPEQLKAGDRANYNHCLGNFWGMLSQTMKAK